MLTKTHLYTLRRYTPPAKRNRLKKAVELAGLTQNEVAFGTRLHASYVSDIINGRYVSLTVRNAHRFRRFFGCDSVDDLFPDEEAK
jgi:transcriptional regulator with XRE-family HTH domain|tara:strand:- start:626 stop:883 length:258 start_codon:yes stop_codon:yes gene_type:complete